MAISLPSADGPADLRKESSWDSLLNILRWLAVGWLLLVGLWSAPSIGATLVYPNGMLLAECVLAIVLLLSAAHVHTVRLRRYPFFWGSVAVITLCALSALLRILSEGTTYDDELLRLWKNSEPLLRGLLLYLAILDDTRAISIAWVTALGGLLLQTAAALAQHVTHMTRWYADLDKGWATGWTPVRDSQVGAATSPQLPPRVQGLTSYINMTAAMLAASISCWSIPAFLGVPASRWGRVLLTIGALATVAALWYTNSRGPQLAVLLVMLVFAWRRSTRWGFSLLAAILIFFLAILPATPWWSYCESLLFRHPVSNEALTLLHAKWWVLTALLFACLLGFFVQRWKLRYLIPLVCALGLGGGLLTLDVYVLNYQLTWRFSETGIEDNARILLYRDALQSILQRPLWGIGDEAVAQRVTHLPGLQQLPVTQQNYHDQYLHWAAAEGIPVALVFTWLLCWAVYWCWCRAKRWTNPFSRALALATATGMTVFLLCNLTDAHFWRIEGGGFFWSLLAFTAAAGQTMEQE